MEDTKRTNREVLSKGIRIMLICLMLMFFGPIVIHISFLNTNKPLLIPLLIVGVLLCFGAIYTLFKGIQTIMNSLFN